MYTGTLSPASNKANFNMSVEVVDDDTDEAIDLTGCTIAFELVDDVSNTTVLSATTDNAKVTIADTGVFAVAFTADDMRTLNARTYRVGCTIANSYGDTQQFIIGTLPVLDGVVQ